MRSLVRRSAAATQDAIEKPGRLCAMVAEQPGRVQEWISGCEQQYALLAGNQAGSSESSTGGRPGRLLMAGEAAALEMPAKQRQLQQLVHDEIPKHVQPNELRLPANSKSVNVHSGDVFSHFEWIDPCDDAVIRAPIEPLVGHLRDPRTVMCDPKSKVPVQSREYMFFLGLTPAQFNRIYPGRRLLMDFGTGVYPSSLGWLLPRYKALGVTFDEIWAWEAAEMNHTKYWEDVPASLKPKMHLYNEGLAANPTSPYHPIAIIKKHVRPGDYLAIKLDVDNSPVELAFMNAIREDDDLRALISEIYFEQHYMHRDVPFFGTSGKGVSYRDMLDFFQGLRQQGLRLHYWP
jgi:hypothetical protein